MERDFALTSVDRPGETPPALPEAAAFLAADLDEGLIGLLRSPFDLIFCADLLEHLKEPDRWLASLPGALAEGGRLVASLPNSGNLYFRFNILMGRFSAHERGLFDRTHLHFYTWRGWVELFEKAGLRMESAEPTTVPFGRAIPRLAQTTLERGLENMYYLAARAWKKMFAHQFAVVARRAEKRS